MLPTILRCMRLWSGSNLMQSRVGSSVLKIPIRRKYYYIPPHQYGHGKTGNLDLFTVMRRNWETIPLFATMAFAMGLVVFAITYAIRHKVDVVFRTHSRDCISRTMNLDCPTVHKMLTINQRHEPWHQMQATLDKMEAAEQRLARRVKICGCDNDGSDF